MHTSLTLPLARLVPHRLPQRDFVIAYGEPLEMTISLVTEDGPDGEPVSLLGTPPDLTLFVAGEGHWPFRDYGAVPSGWATATATAVVAEDGESATITLAPNARVVGRFNWLLVYGGPAGTRFLARGTLDVLHTAGAPAWPGAELDGALVTDGGDPILVVGD